MKLNQFFSRKKSMIVGTIVVALFLSVAMVMAKKNVNTRSMAGKTVYAVFANDNTSGLTKALFDTAVAEFKAQGDRVDELNLYEHASDMPFFEHNRKAMESHPFYLENKQRFLDADVLLIVFPVYWYSVPGILKTWIDMLSGWSYKYESGRYAQPLHKIKQVFVLYACAQATSPKNSEGLTAVEFQVSETCKFIGIPDVQIHGVADVYGLQSGDAQKHLDAIKKMIRC